MSIAAGTRLGPYEVVAPVGAGGMGEVYRGTDTRLNRVVALKILPSHLSSNPELRERFDREARAISSLSHPHICTLYDVGHHDGTDYLVMEFVDGESLEERLKKGPLPMEQVLRYGIEIADALDKAHRAGIVHRDLKPGNIMITKSGVKLLDFGLAKMALPETPVIQLSHLPTAQRQLTQEGTILGTFQYMAPEQLEGLEADARTDIFAFGTVLYEMATGKRAFEGKTKTSLIAAIVDRDPPAISSIQPMTPPAFERVVKTCLAKDPDDRWQSARDIANELRWIQQSGPSVAVAPKRSSLAWPVICTVLALMTIAATALYVRSILAVRNQPPMRTSILPPDKGTFEFFIEGAPPAISSDSKKIVFGASVSGGPRTLWLRTVDSPVPKPLNGTEGAGQAFWSPDSHTIAFYCDGFLRKINAAGGTPVNVSRSEAIRGGSWGPDGTMLVGYVAGPVMKVPAGGGTLTEATILSDAERDNTHRWPWFLPDGKHFLFLAGPHPVDESLDAICVGSVDDKGMRKPIVRASSNAVYHRGWILFVRDQLLMAQRFDEKKLEVRGDPVALPEQRIEFDTIVAHAMFSIADDGSLVYQSGEGHAQTQLTWLDRAGKPIGSTGEPGAYSQIALSPDGHSIAFAMVRQNIWMYDRRGIKTRITFTPTPDITPMWSPDGTKLAFGSRRGRYTDIYVKDLRTGAEQPLIVSNEDKTVTDWSLDGAYLFYTTNPRASRGDIHYFSFADRKDHVYLATPFAEGGARLSPDGKWVAYWSAESPPRQAFVAPFPPTGAKWQVSARGGSFPKWRADGKELYFVSGGKLFAASVKLGPVPEFGQPAPLFDLRFGAAQSFDVTPDGQKFVLNGRVGDAPPPAPLTLVQHFDTVLREVGQ